MRSGDGLFCPVCGMGFTAFMKVRRHASPEELSVPVYLFCNSSTVPESHYEVCQPIVDVMGFHDTWRPQAGRPKAMLVRGTNA